MSADERRSISQCDRLALIGLGVLAADLNRQAKVVESIVARVTGAESDNGYFGHASDFVFNSTGDPAEVDELLSKMSVVVRDE